MKVTEAQEGERKAYKQDHVTNVAKDVFKSHYRHCKEHFQIVLQMNEIQNLTRTHERNTEQLTLTLLNSNMLMVVKVY